MVTERLFLLLLSVALVPACLLTYLGLAEGLLKILPQRQREGARPWFWLAPAVLLLGVFLAYPTLNTAFLSLKDARSVDFVGAANYLAIFSSDEVKIALRNNLLWLTLFTVLTVTLGLLVAVLSDRVRYEAAVKAIIFLPMAISFVAAGVIWKFMFDYRPSGSAQTGTLNALWTSLPGTEPQAWLINQPWNNAALILAAVWMFTGFCMVILSAGLKGIPKDLIEAAKLDGADSRQVFFRVITPLLAPTLTVVTTTMVITSLKIFDIVYVLTNGNFDTGVMATQMYRELFSSRHYGQASAIAVTLLVATLPVMVYNVLSLRQAERR